MDRRALPAPELAVADAPFAMPRTPAEEALAAIWGVVLERERIGIHDNFFALGGDSILGLQALSRAAQVGLRLTLRELFRHPTIAELAPLARAAEGVPEAVEPLAGEVPLTPVQRDLFARELPRPHHWNWSAAGLATVREPLAPGVLERALAAVARYHDAFRLRFLRYEGSWRQLYAEDDAGAACARVDLRALASGAQLAVLAAACAAVQASLDLARGPVLRAVLFELGGGRPDRLLVAVHHLVMDGVSWRIFAEDLEAACRQAAAGKEIRLPPASSPFGTWARRLTAFAASDLLLDEATYWAAQGGEEEPLPVDFPRRDGAGRESSASSVRRTLGTEESAALVADVHAAYQTRVEDLLRAALMRALARWTGRRVLRVDLEGHGREEPSRTSTSRARSAGSPPSTRCGSTSGRRAAPARSSRRSRSRGAVSRRAAWATASCAIWRAPSCARRPPRCSSTISGAPMASRARASPGGRSRAARPSIPPGGAAIS